MSKQKIVILTLYICIALDFLSTDGRCFSFGFLMLVGAWDILLKLLDI